jgi:hypothetical protein
VVLFCAASMSMLRVLRGDLSLLLVSGSSRLWQRLFSAGEITQAFQQTVAGSLWHSAPPQVSEAGLPLRQIRARGFVRGTCRFVLCEG